MTKAIIKKFGTHAELFIRSIYVNYDDIYKIFSSLYSCFFTRFN